MCVVCVVVAEEAHEEAEEEKEEDEGKVTNAKSRGEGTELQIIFESNAYLPPNFDSMLIFKI